MFQIRENDSYLSRAWEPTKERVANESLVGRIHKKKSSGGMDLGYYWFTSSQPRPELPLFVAVHGIARRAHDQAKLFAPFVEAIGGILVAPVFSRKYFSGYQRLGFDDQDVRSDLAFQRLIKKFSHDLGIPNQPVVMFGYSGGGQFVHRYAMAYPRQVKRMAIAAPGWYTFPDLRTKYPQGVRNTSVLPDLAFDASRFLRIPSLVLVGEGDVNRGRSLNRKAAIDRQQGKHRVERAYQWIKAMKAAAKRYHYDTPYHLYIVPGCGHSFSDCMIVGQMGWQITRFLFGEDDFQQMLFDRSAVGTPKSPIQKGEGTC